MFDAYTIKKFMPRLVIAVIAVNLSWEICQILLQITNILGQNISSLIIGMAPQVLEPTAETGGDTQAVLTLAGVALIGVTTLSAQGFIFVPILITVLAALVIGFLTLILRQLVIITLIIISPVALVLWVFPGMDQWAKRWFNTFWKVLLMYPIIMGLIAAGELGSRVIAQAGTGTTGEGTVISGLVAVVVKFLPFFFIPLTFKLVGGLAGQLTGMINDRGKGIFDRGKNAARNHKTGKQLDKEAKKSEAQNRRLNRRRAIAYDPESGARRSLGSRMGQRVNPWERTMAGRDKSADEAVTGAQVKQYGLRKQNAENATIEMTAKSVLLDAQQAAQKKADIALARGEDTGKAYNDSLKATLDELAEKIGIAVRSGDSSGAANNQAAFNTVAETLVHNKGHGQLEEIQKSIADGTASQGVARAWDSTMRSSTFSTMRDYDPGLVAQVSHGMNTTDPNALYKSIASKISTSNAEQIAGMDEKGWSNFYSYHEKVAPGSGLAEVNKLLDRVKDVDAARKVWKPKAIKQLDADGKDTGVILHNLSI